MSGKILVEVTSHIHKVIRDTVLTCEITYNDDADIMTVTLTSPYKRQSRFEMTLERMVDPFESYIRDVDHCLSQCVGGLL